MLEQTGGLYNQLPINITNPFNTTYKRLYQSLTDGKFYLRHHDGTEELFSSVIGVSGAMSFQGGFDASANTLPVAPAGSGPAGAIAKGDVFVVTVAGNPCGTPLTVGDLIIAKIDNAAVCADFAFVEMAGAFVPYTGANQTVDLNTQNLLVGEFFTLGNPANSSVLQLRNADAGKELLIKADVVGFNNVILQLGTTGSLTAFMFSAPAVSFDKNLRFDTAAITSIYVNNGGLGLQLMGRNDISGAFGITILDAGQLQLATATSGSGVLIAGSAVIATGKITANSKISVIATNSLGVGVAVGVMYESKVARVAGTSFTITSEDLLGNVVGTDIRTFDWFFIEERI